MSKTFDGRKKMHGSAQMYLEMCASAWECVKMEPSINKNALQNTFHMKILSKLSGAYIVFCFQIKEVQKFLIFILVYTKS